MFSCKENFSPHPSDIRHLFISVPCHSESAVKKSSRSMKSVIKLDKNFHIYVHGGEGLIKKGYDPETGMAFYQLYFKEEE